MDDSHLYYGLGNNLRYVAASLPECHHCPSPEPHEGKLKRSDIHRGGFYVGGSMDRIREVLEAHDWWVDWRDIDPENLPAFSYFTRKGNCSPKSFAAWAKRRATPEEVSAVLAKAERAE